ncbi:MAG: Mammalian cell entry related domain protein, partial [Solirubrobacterales bacterium]|nr:Mammalian cell entry related domain protein [Solirubrobacterales bacterium]
MRGRWPVVIVAVGALVGAGLVALLAHGREDPTFTARFTNARGLVAGTDVRVGGAIAGRVREVALADDGTALVRFTVDDPRARPRTDAAAGIRPVDLLGDNYLSLSPGSARGALARAIPASRTSNAPRLDQLLGAFRPPVRDALRTVLVEGGLALDARGTDVASSAVALRPALEAADAAAEELDAQNRALVRAVTSADRAAGQ